MSVLLDDYDQVHNKYLENRVSASLDKYDKIQSKHNADRIIDFLGSNKSQIKKYVLAAGMKTNWKNILERVFEMYDTEIVKVTPPKNHQEKCIQYSYYCTKRPFVALYDNIVACEGAKFVDHYDIKDYLAAF
jgi:hypothetical protein